MGGRIKIGTAFTVVTLVAVLAFSAIFVTLGLYHSRRAFVRDRQDIYSRGIESEKASIQSTNQQVHNYISVIAAEAEDHLKAEAKQRVDEGWRTAKHLYNHNFMTMTKEQIEDLIREALRPIRFDNGEGYYYMDRFNGDVILYPTKPELEGTNALGLQDDYGNFVIRDEINIAQNHGQGFVNGYWESPTQKGESGLKISYVREVQPFDFYIGSGLYVQSYTDKLQAETLSHLSDFLEASPAGIRAYIYDGQGQLLLAKDPQGVGPKSVVKDAMTIAHKSENGSFLTYALGRPDDELGEWEYSGYGFAQLIKERDWMVLVESDLDAVMPKLEDNVIQYEYNVRVVTEQSIFFVGVMLIIAFVALYFIRVNIRKSFHYMHKVVDANPTDLVLPYSEINELADHIRASQTSDQEEKVFEDPFEAHKPGRYNHTVLPMETQWLDHSLQSAELLVSDLILAYKGRLHRTPNHKDTVFYEATLERLQRVHSIVTGKLRTEEVLLDTYEAKATHILLESTIQDAFHMVTSEYDQAPQLRLHCDERFQVFADELVITQVLTHLLAYSMECSLKDVNQGEVLIEVMYDDDWYRIVYRDNGVGIPAAVHEQILEGDGLIQGSPCPFAGGLMTAKGLVVERLQGSLNVIAQEEGAHFCVDLPRQKEGSQLIG